jgi:hypothetical protein
MPHQPATRPLPDAVAGGQPPGDGTVRRVLLPDAAPPFDAPPCDGQPAQATPAAWPASPVASAGREPGAKPGTSRPATPERPARRTAADGTDGWPGQFAQALAEALTGARPPQQVTTWTTEQARRRIRQIGPLLQASQRPRVHRIRTCVPRPGVVEMTVIVGIGQRVRALAVRMERDPGQGRVPAGQPRWVCTAIEAA